MRAAILLALLSFAAPAQSPAPAPIVKPVCEPLTGTVIDPDGKPAAGAEVELWRADGQDMSGLDLAYNSDYRLLARVRTGKNGGFGLQVPRGLRCQLRVDLAPHAHWLSDAIDSGEPMRIELLAPATFTGKVVLADGTGTPARLRAWNREGTDVLAARTDAQGVFRCERLPGGAVTVAVEPERASAPEWAKLAFVAGDTVEQTFTCKPGEVLRGRVVDAVTQKPIAGARVGEGWVLHRAVVTDQDGHYTLPGFGSDGYNDVHCTADGYVRVMRTAKQIPAGNPRTLDLRLEAGHAASGQVVTPEGVPLAGVYVAVAGTVHDGNDQYHYWVAGRTDAAGRFRLQGIRPDLPPTLQVRQDGWASLVYHLPDGKDGVHDAGRIVMQRARLVQGQVLGADGKPRARVKVGLWGTNGDRCHMATLPAPQGGMGGWSLLRDYLDLHEAYTDASGRFAFGDIAAGDYTIAVYGPLNEREQSSAAITVKADADPAPVVLTVGS